MSIKMENKELESLIIQVVKERSDRDFLIQHWDYMPEKEQLVILKLLNRLLSVKLLLVKMDIAIDFGD